MSYNQPYTVIENHGIWHYPVKNNGREYLPPIRLCDEFKIVGYAIDKEGLSHHVIEYGESQQTLIPCGEVGTNDGWRKLRNYINIPSSRRKLDLLTEYIQENTSTQKWSIPERAGWHNEQCYILPNGEIIGEHHNILFSGKIAEDKKQAFAQNGTLEQWQKCIGRYSANNSRLLLFMGAAFAAPLMKWLNIDGGVLHVYGNSSSGKTTFQQAAQSIWGHGKNAAEDWDTTAYALTNTALACNDGLLSLDEISKDGGGDSVKRGIYAVSNGKGRTRGNVDVGNRPTARFRVLSISTGETDLETHLRKYGKEVMAGELVRCPSVLQQLEDTHDFKNARLFTNHLNEAVAKYYGTAGRVYIQKLIQNIHDNKLKVIEEYERQLKKLLKHHLTDQAARTARLFAATLTGISMACEAGILPIDKHAALDCMLNCFVQWWQQQPKHQSYEEDKILQQALDFIQTNDLFFIDPDSPYLVSHECPGYVKRHRKNSDKEVEYFVFPKIFREKICAGFNENKVIEILSNHHWLAKDQSNRWQFQLQGVDYQTHKRKRLGRFYKFIGIEPNMNTPDSS